VNRLNRGFTLIEMAVVLMIVGLLLGGMLVPLTAQMDQRNISDTQKSLSDIKEAIIGYTLANGRLPCPATATIPTTTSGAGIEKTSGSGSSLVCSNASGVVPWSTLGVNETDAWGHRFTYRVMSDFADGIGSSSYGGCPGGTVALQATFALCSLGNLSVMSAKSGGTTIASNIPAVIISHGKNGAGAYTPLGGSPLPVGSNDDEKENSDGSGNTKYVSHTIDATFDDLVDWISPNILMNRMVAAGKLP
jgi:prepilin-type N-terminal cleavage/methylation domain-containing protein